jgi:hypothetical protein
MKNKGKNQYRFKNNPLEEIFANVWERLNTDFNGRLDGKGTLDYLLANTVNDPRGEVTCSDRRTAATVIQWLGSPVGQGFLREVFEKAGEKKVYTSVKLKK